MREVSLESLPTLHSRWCGLEAPRKVPEPLSHPHLSGPKGHVDLLEARGKTEATGASGTRPRAHQSRAGVCVLGVGEACPRGVSPPTPALRVPSLCSGWRLSHFLHFCEGKSLGCLPSPHAPPERRSQLDSSAKCRDFRPHPCP